MIKNKSNELNESNETQNSPCLYCQYEHKYALDYNYDTHETIDVHYNEYSNRVTASTDIYYYAKKCQECINHKSETQKQLIDKIEKILQAIDKDFLKFTTTSINAVNNQISEQIKRFNKIVLPNVESVKYLYDINDDTTTSIKENLLMIIKYIDLLKSGTIKNMIVSLDIIKQLQISNNEKNLENITTIKSKIDSLITQLDLYQSSIKNEYKKLFDLIDEIILDVKVNKVTKTYVKTELKDIVLQLTKCM
jgi:hypothetical protein